MNSMVQRPSETVSHSASQENSPPFTEYKVSLLCSQEPATGSIPSQMNFIHNFPPYFPMIHSNNILPSVFYMVFSLQIFQLKFCTLFSSYVHATFSANVFL